MASFAYVRFWWRRQAAWTKNILVLVFVLGFILNPYFPRWVGGLGVCVGWMGGWVVRVDRIENKDHLSAST